jgi:hypothetical protein
LQSLLARAAHINHTVLELPADVASKVSLVNSTLCDFMKLYEPQDGLLTLPDKITQAGARLVMPDTSAFAAQLRAGEAALNTAPGLQHATAELSRLLAALSGPLRQATAALEPALDAFERDDSGDGSERGSASRGELVDALAAEGPTVAALARGLRTSSSPAGSFKGAMQPVLAALQAALGPAQKEVDAIPGALAQIGEFDVIDKYLGPLAQAQKVYAQFGGNPANVSVCGSRATAVAGGGGAPARASAAPARCRMCAPDAAPPLLAPGSCCLATADAARAGAAGPCV